LGRFYSLHLTINCPRAQSLPCLELLGCIVQHRMLHELTLVYETTLPILTRIVCADGGSKAGSGKANSANSGNSAVSGKGVVSESQGSETAAAMRVMMDKTRTNIAQLCALVLHRRHLSALTSELNNLSSSSSSSAPPPERLTDIIIRTLGDELTSLLTELPTACADATAPPPSKFVSAAFAAERGSLVRRVLSAGRVLERVKLVAGTCHDMRAIPVNEKSESSPYFSTRSEHFFGRVSIFYYV
jgi:hypothetical protein